MVNYEPWYNGGYRRVPGYERFDGRPRPHLQAFTGFTLDTTVGLVAGTTVLTGDASGATGLVVAFDATTNAVAVTKTAGTPFTQGEAFNTASYTMDALPIVGVDVAPTEDLLKTFRLAAEDEYRSDILAIPGAGVARGAWRRDSDTFGIRDNAGQTAGIIHLASAAGWTTTGITMAETIRFDTGVAAGATVAEGDTVTGGSSGATATIHRIVLNGGSVAWDGSGEGYLVLTNVMGGPFTTAEPLESPALTTIATADGVNSEFALSPGGHYRFHNHNFFGGATTYRVYGCNGLDPAFEIDENNIVSPILMPVNPATGEPPANNTPFEIEEHRNHLFLGFPGGSVQHAVPGLPLCFSGFLGAAEFGIGSELTGLNSVAGGVLVMTTDRETQGLFGTGVADWEKKLLGEQTGGRLFTTQKIDTVYALDDLGITNVARTDAFGDFVGATVSQLVQTIVTAQRSLVTDSTIVRESNQYRVYFSDNSALVMYVPAGQVRSQEYGGQRTVEFGFLSYDRPVNKIYNTEDETGKERTFFCSDDGFVYEDQVGRSFDGASIESYVRLPFHFVKTPAYRKRFRRADLELQALSTLSLKFSSDLSYGDPDIGSGQSDITTSDVPELDVFGGGGFWDDANWDEFLWDGQNISRAQANLTGSGENVGFLIFHDSAVDDPFILQGITLHYDIRRIQR
jgi:hypothetical protein